jgi:hypothetical protein
MGDDVGVVHYDSDGGWLGHFTSWWFVIDWLMFAVQSVLVSTFLFLFRFPMTAVHMLYWRCPYVPCVGGRHLYDRGPPPHFL